MSTEPEPCVPVAFDDLQLAYDYVEMGGDGARAYLDPRTGRIYWVSPDLPDENAPEDLGESDVYIAIPDKFKLDLGRSVVDDFVEEALPDDWNRVADIFRGKGAYGRFKQFLHHRGVLERWHAFEAAATDQALREWCEVNNIPLKAP